jgi:hypothetical protein
VADNKHNSPDYRCKSAADMLTDIEIVRDVSGGTRHLRDCKRSTLYLPPEPAEQPSAYAIRKSKALLFNAYERALHSLVGMVFRKEPELSEDVPDVMAGAEGAEGTAETEGQLEDCDLAGTYWTVFAKDLFTDALRDGHAFLMVDMPPALPAGSTLADEKASGRRPYWVKYKADQACNWRTDSRGRLTQITFEECTWEADGEYGEAEVYRYRVLRPGSWQLYRKTKDEKTGADSVTLESEGTTSLTEIPVAVCYGRRLAPLVSKPPLLDLAMVNLAHYSESSDYRIYLHIASRPILWFKGRDKSSPIQNVGPYTTIDVSDTQPAGVFFAETTGAALGAARQDLKDLEDYMAILGLSMLAEKVPNKTATEASGDQVRELSELATAARSLHDCIEQSLRFQALYQGLPSGGSATLGVTDDDLTMTDQEMNAYNAMAGSVLSKKTVREVLKERGKLPETYSEEEELKRLESEGAEAAARQQESLGNALLNFNRGGNQE